MIRSAQIVFLTLMLVLPGIAFIHIWPLNSAIPDGLVLSLSGILFSLALLRGAAAGELRFSALVFCPLGLIIPLVISHLIADVVLHASLNWLIISLVLASLMVIVAEQFDGCRNEYQRFVARVLMIAGLVYAGFALLQHFGVVAYLMGLPAPNIGRLKGAWQQPNLTTSTLWVTFFAAVYVTRCNKKLIGIFAFSIFIGAALAFAASRLNFLLLPFALALGGYLLRSKKSELFIQGRQLIVGAVVILISLILLPELVKPLESQLVSSGWVKEANNVSLFDRGASDRPRVMEHLKIAASLNQWTFTDWVFGQGAGQYGVFSYQQPVIALGEAGRGQGAWLHSHNLFSMIFVEAGLFGLLVLVLLVGVVFYTGWRHRASAWFVPGFGGLGVIFAHSLVEYPLWYPWYLIVAVLLAVPWFITRKVSVTSPWLFSTAGIAALIVVVGLTLNLSGQVKVILETAVSSDSSESTYRRLALLSNDGLLGPFAVLTRYRRFSPETVNLEWQLKEVRRISEWRPLDLVQLREVTLLLMMREVEEACERANETVLRFPAAGPIILEKASLLQEIGEQEMAGLSRCVRNALGVWGETIESMTEKNNYLQGVGDVERPD